MFHPIKEIPHPAQTALKMLPNIHPGEILQKDFLWPFEISEYRLAKSIQVPARRINEIIHGKRSVTADTAIRLGIFFGNSPEFWLNLQNHFDLHREWDQNGERLVREIPPSHQFS